jgi:vacuolar protein sorting-associated protein 16
MDVAHPTAGWEQLGECFYRKIQLYTQVFDQDLDLDNYLVAGAPYGGAIGEWMPAALRSLSYVSRLSDTSNTTTALYRDEEKVIPFQATKPSKPSIDIYSCAGKLLRRITWDQRSIKGLGWSEDEKLLVVTADGTVRSYFDFESEFDQFSLGNGAEETGVKSCKFYAHGLVALLNNNALVLVSSYDEPRPKLLAPPPEGQVHSWSIIPPAYTLSRSVEVLLSINQTIYVSDASECVDRFLDIGPFTHIAVSPNGKYLALYTATGKAHVISSDFQDRYSEHDSRSKIPPKYFEWCGNDAVVIAWEDEVHLVGPSGSMATFFYDSGRVHIIPGTSHPLPTF